MYTPRTVDLNGLPFEHPVDGRSVYYRGGNDIPNPNWLVKYTDANSSVSRLSGKTSLSYDILDNLSITYRGGYDTYYEFQEYIVNKGVGPGPANPARESRSRRTASSQRHRCGRSARPGTNGCCHHEDPANRSVSGNQALGRPRRFRR